MCVPHWKGTTCDESRKSFQNRNAVRLIFHRQPVTHSSLIWSYERVETPASITNTNSTHWKVKPPPLTCWWSDKTNLSKWQPAGLKNKLARHWLTDRGQDQLIIIQVCVGGTCLNSKCCYKAHHLSNISYVPTTLSVKQHIFDTDVIIS